MRGLVIFPDVTGSQPPLLSLPFALYGKRVGVESARPGFLGLHRGDAGAPGADEVPAIVDEAVSADGLARRVVVGLADGARVESVLMEYRGRFTGCLSSQVGCAMGCVFCATGQGGFLRHLTVAEITGQVALLNRVQAARGAAPLRNLVLMGMGEPLHNYEAVSEAMRIVSDPRGAGIAGRHITLSTVGIVPGILRMAEEASPMHLAVSLHGATDEERNALVPVGRRWPLAELMDACRHYARKRRRKVLFEWTLIAGRTDTPEQARAVGALLRDVPCQMNVIPLNPTPGFDGRPSGAEAIETFRAILAEHGVPSSVRQRRGIEVAGGCGQLAGSRK